MTMTGRPDVTGFYHEATASIAYVVADPATGKCAIIDPVLDFDDKSARLATRFADHMLGFIEQRGLTVEWILDTHPHADHFSAAHYMQGRLGAPMAIGEKIAEVTALWNGIYNFEGRCDDCWQRLFADGDRFEVGTIEARVMLSPGHTLASVTYVIGDAAFVHDTLLMPDFGTARADFPGGDARALWRSIEAILALPDATRLFVGHDYRPGGREAAWESTVAEQKAGNAHLKAYPDEESFVAFRRKRDKELPMPELILHALQVNIKGGRLPEPETNGRRYLKIPIDAL
jgi:glyoxylase-like metal-dependent hydrolase (beta-lactamase superfamily II)